MKNITMNIAIDFDGTIHDRDNPLPGRRMGRDIPLARESIEHLKQNLGYRIIIFCLWATTPQNIKTIQQWLEYYQIPYDEITNIKPDADAYIDNRAIRFEGDWNKVLWDYFIEHK